MRISVLSLSMAFCLSIGIAEAQNISDEARRYFDRGQVAVEMAESPVDYEDAIKEFEKAAELAPAWADVYYNLGYVQKEAGQYQGSLDNYRKYLKLVPNASDAEQVRTEINQIEYRLEKVSKEAKIRSWLEGEWVMPTMLRSTRACWPITFIVNGDSISAYMPTTRSMGHDDECTNYKTIPVNQEGRKIQFSVVLKEVYLERGITELMQTVNGQYNLSLTAPDRMEGTHTFSSKVYKFYSDGSLMEDKNGTEKINFWKQKHSDNIGLRMIM